MSVWDRFLCSSAEYMVGVGGGGGGKPQAVVRNADRGATEIDGKKDICKALVPSFLGIERAENVDVFPFLLIVELGEVPTHASWSRSRGGSSQKPGLHFLSAQSHVRPCPQREDGGAVVSRVPLFSLLVLYSSIYIQRNVPV